MPTTPNQKVNLSGNHQVLFQSPVINQNNYLQVAKYKSERMKMTRFTSQWNDQQ